MDKQGAISAKAWAELEFIATPYCEICGIPFEFQEAAIGDACCECSEKPKKYNRARAALIYNDTSRDLILGFKHGDKTHIAPTFVPWLLRSGQKLIDQSDVIVPVPLHYRRLITRRYNQAAIIAQTLAKTAKKPHLPMALKRIKATASQGHLKADERTQNVANAFQINQRYKAVIKDQTVLLIDDVYTTGATINECTKTLLEAGAAKVNVLTLARVTKN